jgi:hypothetical protein
MAKVTGKLDHSFNRKTEFLTYVTDARITNSWTGGTITEEVFLYVLRQLWMFVITCLLFHRHEEYFMTDPTDGTPICDIRQK